MKTATTMRLKTASQILFLILFLFLAMKNTLQLWMGLFGAGMILSFFAGRLYCGWVCPIHPVVRTATWIKKKLRLPHPVIPEWLQGNALRFGMLGLFVAALTFTMMSGKKLPVLPVLIGVAACVSLVFTESYWHRWLCPYGTLLSLPARFARRNLQIEQSGCISCGKCMNACQAQAVLTSPSIPATVMIPTDPAAYVHRSSPAKAAPVPSASQARQKFYYSIQGKECLLCLECVKVCPRHVIRYTPGSRLNHDRPGE